MTKQFMKNLTLNRVVFEDAVRRMDELIEKHGLRTCYPGDMASLGLAIWLDQDEDTQLIQLARLRGYAEIRAAERVRSAREGAEDARRADRAARQGKRSSRTRRKKRG